MPKEDGVVQAFQFNKDSYDVMEGIYVSILQNLGVVNPHDKIVDAYSLIPEEERNGVMFNKAVASLFKDDADRKAKASAAYEKVKDDPKVSPYVKAYLAEMATGYIPYDTVLTAARMVGGEKGKNGKSLQMGCGEGKTGVLSMAAFSILQSEKRQVFLTSSTELLAAEALDKIDFYEKVGLASELVLVDSRGITRPRMENGKVVRDENGKAIFDRINLEKKNEIDRKRLLKEAYDSKLVISDNVTLMQHSMNGYLEEPTDKKRELLADEADFVLLDSYRPLQKTEELSEEEMAKRVEQRTYAYNLLEQVKKQMPEGLFVKDDANQYVDFTKEGRKLVVEAVRNSKKDLKIDLNTLYDYVYEALVVDTVYKEDRDYQILENGKVLVSEDRASGVGIDLPQGVAQALEIKLQQEGRYTGPITPERKVVDVLNTQTFFKKYFNGTKHFISGTLGAESKEIAEELKNFGVSKEEGDIYEIAPKQKRTRDDRETKFYKNSQRKRREIIKSALREIEEGKPVLIGTVSEKEIKALKDHLKHQTKDSQTKVRILEYTAASESIFQRDKEKLKATVFKKKYGVDKDTYATYESLIKNESGKENTITLGTSILGRGTTIKTSDKVNDAGGIHVIVDGIHETSFRNPIQYLSRTSRGDNNGSTQIFFSEEDIPEEVRNGDYKGRPADEIYDEVYGSINARTCGIRKYANGFVEKTEQKKDEIKQMPFLSEAEKRQAIALLTERSFSIRHRACGVSDQFQTNIEEYEREIDAYAKLYVAKYRVTDEKYLNGGRFDEALWLADNGYEDLAEIHFPFKRSKEKEIFKNAGIKQSKIRKEAIIEAKEKAEAEAKKAEAKKVSKEEKQNDRASQTYGTIQDDKVKKYIDEFGVEMHVAPVVEVVKDAAQEHAKDELVADQVAAEQTNNPGLRIENIEIDLNRKDKYSQFIDMKGALPNNVSKDSLHNDSMINLFGLKKVTVDSKFAIAMSRIKAFTDIIRNVFKNNQRAGKEATVATNDSASLATPDEDARE